MGKLNPIQVKSLTAPGRYVDGDGLMLEVKPSGSKSWVVRLQAGRKRRDYGLGSFNFRVYIRNDLLPLFNTIRYGETVGR